MLEAKAYGIPDFGPVIERRQLIQVFRSQCPVLTVICAPAGCGKSVLAAQLAGHGRFERVLWVSLYDTDVRSDEWLLPLALALMPTSDTDACSAPLTPESISRADAMLRIREGLRQCSAGAACLVLDGCGTVISLELLEEVAGLLRRSCGGGSRLLLTCRTVADCDYVPDAVGTWVVDEHDLRFTRSEVDELLALMGMADDPDYDAQNVLDRFAGHPALTSLVLRHRRLDDSLDPPQDLVWHTRRLVSQLPEHLLRMLYVAAMLREGLATDVRDCLPADECPPDWIGAQATAPLLTIVRDEGGVPFRFRMHAVLGEALLRSVPNRLGADAAAELRTQVLMFLHLSGDYVRAYGVLMTVCRGEDAAQWCETIGSQLLIVVGPDALERCLSRVSPSRVSSSPRLLLLRSAILREQERVDEAFVHANLARRLAENYSDWDAQIRAALLIARLAFDASQLPRARETLQNLITSAGQRLDAAAECQCQAYMAILEAHTGDIAGAIVRAARACGLMDSVAPGSHELVSAVTCVAGVEGLCAGRWDRAAEVMARIAPQATAPSLHSVQYRSNLAVIYLEMGLLSEARSLLEGVLSETSAAGLRRLQGYALGTMAGVLHALNENEIAQETYVESQRILGEKGDTYAVTTEQLSNALARRAAGSADEALALAESAFAQLRDGRTGLGLLTIAAETEIAASLLSLGDSWGARRMASRIREEIADSGACAHLLRVDMVLAEADRLDGEIEVAVNRLAAHADYLMTGSANWLAAMYVRAFPGLLGLFASAVGAEKLPLRMLRMVPAATLEAAVNAPSSFTREGDLEIIASRVGSNVTTPETDGDQAVPAPCHVRLFGGLQVTTGTGTVDEARWRKRKARLLFAMLVIRQGQDLPRDVIMERLWPDMDEEHAKRNFYVTWSTMKRALARGAAPSEAGHLVQCSGGVCRITRAVRSDLNDFDAAVTRLRAAAVIRDEDGVLAAARELAGVYSGELLPGDVYEEWFAEVRERTKHDFCDAMMTAAHTAEARSEFDTALLFLRRASAADPWREDVYQSTMRCQMSAGQRSRAIETYLSCRSKLTEDLGIDPSVETTRLYQAVLAMEEG